MGSETDGLIGGHTQVYVDDAANYASVDFNTLANIEPAC